MKKPTDDITVLRKVGRLLYEAKILERKASILNQQAKNKRNEAEKLKIVITPDV